MNKNEQGEKIKAMLGKYLTLRGSCANMRERIEDKRKEINWLRSLLEENYAGRRAEVCVQAERAAALIGGMIKYYTESVSKREKAERRVIDMLEKIEDDMGRQILYLHYIEGRSFNDIPDDLNMSSRNMWYKYKAAIEQLCALESEGKL